MLDLKSIYDSDEKQIFLTFSAKANYPFDVNNYYCLTTADLPNIMELLFFLDGTLWCPCLHRIVQFFTATFDGYKYDVLAYNNILLRD